MIVRDFAIPARLVHRLTVRGEPYIQREVSQIRGVCSLCLGLSAVSTSFGSPGSNRVGFLLKTFEAKTRISFVIKQVCDLYAFRVYIIDFIRKEQLSNVGNCI